MTYTLRVRYGTKIVEETADLTSLSPSRALRSAEALLAKRNEGLPENSKKRAVLLAIKPVSSPIR